MVHMPSFSPDRDRAVILARTVSRVVRGFDFRQPLHARGVDLGDAVLECNVLDRSETSRYLIFPSRVTSCPF
jgi:hypothetical protein